MHKRVFILLIMMFILTGCVKLDHNMDDIINEVMSNKINYSNTVSNGYKFYRPLGVRQISDKDNNQIFNISGVNVFLYVDVVSYYYKNILNYYDNNNYSYYYKKFEYNNALGYLGINKIDSDYFVKIVYNYSKIEFYCDYDRLDEVTSRALIILNSIIYNDNLLERTLGDSSNTSLEISYQLDGPKGDGSTFSKYLEEYIPTDDVDDDNDVELPTNE